MLTPEQIAAFNRDGFLLVEDALTPPQLKALRRATEELVQRSKAIEASDDVYDIARGHCATRPRLNRIKLPHLHHPAYSDLIRGERMVSILRALLGTNVRLHTSKLNTKPPGGGVAIEWHQDWAFYPHTNDDLLALGIMLEDVTESNGPLKVIPGSHRGPVLSHFRDGVFCGAIDPKDPQFDITSAVTLTGRAGSMSIHHVRTLHGSAANHSDRARPMLFYECGAADAWPINGNSSTYTGLSQQAFWGELSERMICGKQPRTARLESVPVVMPLPPAPDSASIFKVQSSGNAASAFSGHRDDKTQF